MKLMKIWMSFYQNYFRQKDSHPWLSMRFVYIICSAKKADLLALVGDVYCIFVTFPWGFLGQVWYLVVSFPDLCMLSFFDMIKGHHISKAIVSIFYKVNDKSRLPSFFEDKSHFFRPLKYRYEYNEGTLNFYRSLLWSLQNLAWHVTLFVQGLLKHKVSFLYSLSMCK